MRAKLECVARARRRVVALHLDRAVEQCHRGAQVGRGVGVVVPVPSAQVRVRQGLVQLEDEAALLERGHAAYLLALPARRLRHQHPSPDGPRDGLGEAEGRRASVGSLDDVRPRVVCLAVQVEVPHGAHGARVARRSHFRTGVHVTGAKEPAQVGDGDHLGADEGQLDGVPPVAVEGDGGVLLKRARLRAHAQSAAGHPDVGGVEREVLAVELHQARDMEEEERGRVLVQQERLPLRQHHRVPVRGQFGVEPAQRI
mmetsp:Transcript_17640/g.54931  ORF Transcript_17640/g.54931 Transcript_17640/m.54931 type:complete len:256 (-) Transcript_17640:482-1249(-)